MRSQYLNTAKNHHEICRHRSEFLLSVIGKSVDFKMLLLVIFIPNDHDDNYDDIDDDYDDYDDVDNDNDVDDMTMTVTMMTTMMMMVLMMMMLMNIIVIMKVLTTNVSFNCLRCTWSQ